METTPTTLDYVTLGIALWGALLSTFLAVRNMLKDKRHVKVTCRVLERTLSNAGTTEDFVIGFEAVNTGHRDVRLTYAGLKTANKKYHILSTQKLPITLKDGDSVIVRLTLDEAQSYLEGISSNEQYAFAYFMDTERVQYKTSHFPDVMVVKNMVKSSWWRRRQLRTLE